MAQLVGISFSDQNLLNVCCGSGMEAEYFANLGTNLFGLDLSLVALQQAKERARRFGFIFKTIEGDAENLPFKAGSFDFVFVHDGLHHLAKPEKAIIDMARVARKGIFFSEPADAFITRIAVKLGLAGDYEEAGNYVNCLHPRRLKSLFYELGMKDYRFKRYGMWYSHRPSRWFRLLENRVVFGIFKACFYIVNALFGRFGNKLVAVGWREN